MVAATKNVLAVAADQKLDRHEPSEEFTRRRAIQAPIARRIDDAGRQMVSDTFTGLAVPWENHIASAVSQFLKMSMRIQLMTIVLE